MSWTWIAGRLLRDRERDCPTAEDLRGPALSQRKCRPSRFEGRAFCRGRPHLAITDDALVQNIGELRRALGDDGPRLIKTIPRRGYRFEADVSVIAPIDALIIRAALDPPASRDGAQLSGPSVTHASTFPTTALIGWRAYTFAALAIVILLAIGGLLAGLASDGKFLGTRAPAINSGRLPTSARNQRSPSPLSSIRAMIRHANISPTA